MNSIYKDLVAFIGTQEVTAEKLKVDQSTVSGWVRGKHGMSPVVAKRAEALTGGAFKKRIPLSVVSMGRDGRLSDIPARRSIEARLEESSPHANVQFQTHRTNP